MRTYNTLLELLQRIFTVLTVISLDLKLVQSSEQSKIWLDTFDAMEEFHVTDRTLRRWRTENLIESRTLGRKVYYSKSSIEEILKR